MVDVKQAAQRARDSFAELVPTVPVDRIVMEEFESSAEEGRDLWRVTLSVPSGPFEAIVGSRSFRVFTVDKATGEVTSMKIRKVDAVLQ